MWIIVGVALGGIVATLAVWRVKRRSTGPAWDTLSREEQGIIARNSQAGNVGARDSAKALGSAARNNENRSGW